MALYCGVAVITEVTVFLVNSSFPCNAAQLDEFRAEIQRRDQEILAMSAKMKTLEEQHQDYQRHIAVLKESLCAKEEHYNMLQADVSRACL
jgi:chromosome segregation ATPase